MKHLKKHDIYFFYPHNCKVFTVIGEQADNYRGCVNCLVDPDTRHIPLTTKKHHLTMVGSRLEVLSPEECAKRDAWHDKNVQVNPDHIIGIKHRTSPWAWTVIAVLTLALIYLRR